MRKLRLTLGELKNIITEAAAVNDSAVIDGGHIIIDNTPEAQEVLAKLEFRDVGTDIDVAEWRNPRNQLFMKFRVNPNDTHIEDRLEVQGPLDKVQEAMKELGIPVEEIEIW